MRMHERMPRYFHAPRCLSSVREDGSGAGTPRARSIALDMAVSWRMAICSRSARVSGLVMVHHLGTSYGAAARADEERRRKKEATESKGGARAYAA